VEKGGPADEAGLRKGFLVAEIDGQTTGELRNAAQTLFEKKKGETAQLQVVVPRRLGARYVEFRKALVDVALR
jgi:C-terminal processing protease CtpA/Prc